MRVGSVRFFKVLIVATYLLLLLIPLVLAIAFGVMYASEKQRAREFEDALAVLEAEMYALRASNEVPQVEAEPPAAPGTPSFAYQQLYPELYAKRPLAQQAEPGVCYLTFDDGPSATTGRILDTLAQYEVKATFFVTGKACEQNPEILQAAAAAGHTIGVHSYSHDYGAIYASVDAYLADFNAMYTTIEGITGAAPTVFRFAGGSINVYNQQIYTEIIAEMTRRGFVFYDWNAAGSDAVIGGISAAEITNNVLQSASGRDRVMVLLHDRADNATTAAALPGIITGLQQQGYRFAPLTNEVEPISYFFPD